MRCMLAGDGSESNETELGEIDPGKQMFPFAQKDRRHGQVHLVDLIRGQILPNDGNTACNSDIFALGRFFGSLESSLRSIGDEMERGASFHHERNSRVMREHKNIRMVRRSLAHQPLQESPSHGPRTGPNILRPNIQAPTFSND